MTTNTVAPVRNTIEPVTPERDSVQIAATEAQKAAEKRSLLANAAEAKNKVVKTVMPWWNLAKGNTLPAIINTVYAQKGENFHRKSDNALAFTATPAKLETTLNDAVVVAHLLTIAEHRGWSTIKVDGEEAFKRQVWLEASLKGLIVQGYTPNEQDKLALQQRQTGQAPPAPEPVQPIAESVNVNVNEKELNTQLNFFKLNASSREHGVMGYKGDGSKWMAIPEAQRKEIEAYIETPKEYRKDALEHLKERLAKDPQAFQAFATSLALDKGKGR